MPLWEDMSQEEKIEDLRRDVKRLFNVANDHLDRIRALAGAVAANSEAPRKVEAALKALQQP
jgi:hypothetical protein